MQAQALAQQHPREVLLRLYTEMVRSRVLDEQLIVGFTQNKFPWAWHSGMGQEAIVGAITPLREDDYATYTHRGCYVWVAKGMSMNEILAEMYGKRTGCCKGKGGHHVSDVRRGICGRSGTQGGHFPVAVGMGIAAQLAGRGQVVVSCFGDGCANRGTLHESMNLAAISKLPIIWLCENNGYAMSVPLSQSWAVPNVSDIAAGYATPATVVDGNDVLAVYEAATAAIDRARKGLGPSFLELKTYRLRGHNEGDAARYRPPEEVEEWRHKDPIPRFRQYLLSQGVMSEPEAARIQQEAEAEVREAADFADQSPWPSPQEAFEDLYAPA